MTTPDRQEQSPGEETSRLRIPKLDDLSRVVDKDLLANFARLYKLEMGEMGVSEGTYIAVPIEDQALVLVLHQNARSFIREGKIGEHRHWKYDSFIGQLPDARSTKEEKQEFDKRVSKVRRSPRYKVSAHEINGRVINDIKLVTAQKAG